MLDLLVFCNAHEGYCFFSGCLQQSRFWTKLSPNSLRCLNGIAFWKRKYSYPRGKIEMCNILKIPCNFILFQSVQNTKTKVVTSCSIFKKKCLQKTGGKLSICAPSQQSGQHEWSLPAVQQSIHAKHLPRPATRAFRVKCRGHENVPADRGWGARRLRRPPVWNAAHRPNAAGFFTILPNSTRYVLTLSTPVSFQWDILALQWSMATTATRPRPPSSRSKCRR